MESDVRVSSAERHPLRLGSLQCPGDRRRRGRLLDAAQPLLASALAFASGALITALAFDLFQESFERGGAWLSAIGVVGGAVTFVVADALLDRYIAEGGSNVMAPNSAFALLAAVTLDGIPENMALGVSLLETSGTRASRFCLPSSPPTFRRRWAGQWGCASRDAPDASPSECGAPQQSCSPLRWC